MKHRVTKFKSPQVALKELEPFIRNGEHLQTGKPFEHFGGLRSREVLANWLICAAVNSGRPTASLIFTSDPTGGDGIIYDTEAEADFPTEHVLVPRAKPDEQRDIPTLISTAISQKQEKGGAAYASGKTLIVFLEAGLGRWVPNQVPRQIPKTDFEDVWVVGLQGVENGEYVYAVTRLTSNEGGNAPVWLVRISKDFGTWQAQRTQW